MDTDEQTKPWPLRELLAYHRSLSQYHQRRAPFSISSRPLNTPSRSISRRDPDPRHWDGQTLTRNVSGYRYHGPVDPMIPPDVYAPSGFNMMQILIQLDQRPNPQFNLGKIDSNVALVLCDTQKNDVPIVYCSDGFCMMTGYSEAEVLGRNCRFLQMDSASLSPLRANQYQITRYANDESELNVVRGAIKEKIEVRAQLVNFRKDGTKFLNLMTLIPIGSYIVGLQAASLVQDESAFISSRSIASDFSENGQRAPGYSGGAPSNFTGQSSQMDLEQYTHGQQYRVPGSSQQQQLSYQQNYTFSPTVPQQHQYNPVSSQVGDIRMDLSNGDWTSDLMMQDMSGMPAEFSNLHYGFANEVPSHLPTNIFGQPFQLDQTAHGEASQVTQSHSK